jgi:RimJ/RimL family protein N-acetyltransferase
MSSLSVVLNHYENANLTQSFQLETPRLLLRPWEEADRAPFAAMNADPVVMRFYPAPYSRVESDAAIDRYSAAFERVGFSFFAAISRETGAFAGTIGLQAVRDEIPNLPQPSVEIGWRLTQACQGRGLATEGALAIIDFAFHQLALGEVVAITAMPNQPSRRVMEKVGMTYRPEFAFNHPRVPAGHPYERHALYSLRNPNSFEVSCSTPL